MGIVPRMWLGLVLLWSAGCARANELGAGEWPVSGSHECIVIPALVTAAGWEFYAAFSRHWCLQGWSATVQLLLQESRADKWLTRIDILSSDELVLTIPMSPYVEQNMEKVVAGVVGKMAAQLMQAEMNATGNIDSNPNADSNAGKESPPIPGAKQPGGERK